ncbi:DUF4097 family beta strand repeat-containing protein [Cecembia sp.]|uniref:DUF4097 family beta strand repeat-containing protein n=1 Tax=Cecembia sp. TaxID=1898110 RepID=UPI0025BC6B6B|nr:DUF4097 family beta strand repeat-containing protein [Cecembia sp.]
MMRIGLVLALGLMVSACAVAEKTYTKSYEEQFSGVKEVEIEGRFLEVSYEGREGDQDVFMNAFLEAAENSGLDIKFRQSGSRLKIEVVGNAVNTGFNFGNQNKGFISLTGPENMKVRITNTSGPVEAMHVSHDVIDLKVSSGSISASDLEVDDIHFTASSGSIRGERLYGTINCQISSGNVRLNEVIGDIQAKGSSGSLRFEQVEGKVDAKVSSGGIKLSDVREIGDLSTSSGSIRAESSGLGASTLLKSSSGSIRISTTSDLDNFNFDLKAGSGSVKVGERSSSKNLKIENGAVHTISGSVSSGSIRIEI